MVTTAAADGVLGIRCSIGFSPGKRPPLKHWRSPVGPQADGRLRHASALADLRDGLLARLAPKDAARTEADAEAVLTAMGSVTRPGPRVNLAPKVLDAVIETLRGPFRLQLRYGEPDAPERVIGPHGLLLGHRSQPSSATWLLLCLNPMLRRPSAAEISWFITSLLWNSAGPFRCR